MNACTGLLLLLGGVGLAPGATQDGAQAKAKVEARVEVGVDVPLAVHAGLTRALDFLLADQNRDGSWGGVRNMMYTDVWPNVEAHRSFIVATTALGCMALLAARTDETALAAVDRGLDYVVANHDLRRCDDWDIDNVWGLLYGFHALVRALPHPRYASGPRREAMVAATHKLLARIAYYQSPTGGWGYYADAIDAWRPQWATSFTTAAMVIAFKDAEAAGLAVPAKVLETATRAVARSRLPSGAYTYDVMAIPDPGSVIGINDVRGSLCRIPVCNLALLRAGRKLPAGAVEQGFDQLFTHHRFLDCARMRPIPHEAYHYNSGYFYLFGHWYAAELLEHLPAARRRIDAAKLAHEILKTQEPSGVMWDYYMANYTRPYGTAFGALALAKIGIQLEE